MQLKSRLIQIINLIPKTSIQFIADAETQGRYIQLDKAGVDELFIKFIRKGENDMPKYEIVSDVDNKIVYNEVYEYEVDRVEIANYRAKIEELKLQKEGIEKEIAELEALVEKGEAIVKLADEKKAEEVVAEEPVAEENVVVEGE